MRDAPRPRTPEPTPAAGEAPGAAAEAAGEEAAAPRPRGQDELFHPMGGFGNTPRSGACAGGDQGLEGERLPGDRASTATHSPPGSSPFIAAGRSQAPAQLPPLPPPRQPGLGGSGTGARVSGAAPGWEPAAAGAVPQGCRRRAGVCRAPGGAPEPGDGLDTAGGRDLRRSYPGTGTSGAPAGARRGGERRGERPGPLARGGAGAAGGAGDGRYELDPA